MKITVAFMRDVLRQYDKEEISFSRMVEILNEQAHSEELLFLKRLDEGGVMKSSSQCLSETISKAQADKNFFYAPNFMGYVYFPQTEPNNQ